MKLFKTLAGAAVVAGAIVGLNYLLKEDKGDEYRECSVNRDCRKDIIEEKTRKVQEAVSGFVKERIEEVEDVLEGITELIEDKEKDDEISDASDIVASVMPVSEEMPDPIDIRAEPVSEIEIDDAVSNNNGDPEIGPPKVH